MARSGRYVNFIASIKDGGGSFVAQKEIMGYQIHRGKKLLDAYGDAKIFPSMKVVVDSSRSISITGGDVSALLQLPADDTYSVKIILLDAGSWNGVTPTTATGACTATLSNCKISEDSHSGQNNEFGMSVVTFQAFAPDGVTDPLVVAEAT